MTINEKMHCSVNESDNADMFIEKQDTNLDFQKLEDILEIVKRWQTVPENIKRQMK